MICHYLRKSYFDGRYPVIDRADDMVGGPPGFVEPFLFEKSPIILNAPEGQVSQEKAGQDDPEPEKQNNSAALMHLAFHPGDTGCLTLDRRLVIILEHDSAGYKHFRSRRLPSTGSIARIVPQGLDDLWNLW